ncbi:MAG TPA: ROK family protein [Candidatus Acidoferrum sp.]|nr:ROK family protein [Candidatus Acidoferrum sp.]
MSQNSKELILGVDIGGTKIAAGLVNREGTILKQIRKPMVANSTAEAGLDAVVNAIDEMTSLTAAEGGFTSIGICAPGPLDPRTGVILNPPNVPCWRNFPLGQKLTERYGQRVKVDKDSNAAALAETRWGAARGYHYVFYITLGTGIGTGLVLDGRVYRGNTGAAGEGGHMTIDPHGPVCGCGKPGCIEILAAGPAIGARARAKIAAEPSRGAKMVELAKGNPASVASEHVAQAYAAGDPLAREVLEETIELLTAWLSNIVDLLDPDILVIGGGVAQMLQPFFGELKQGLLRWCVNPHVADISLVLAHYRSDAGIAGGAALCVE